MRFTWLQWRRWQFLPAAILVKDCAHHQVNEIHTKDDLTGPIPPSTFPTNEKSHFRTLMSRAAQKAQTELQIFATTWGIPGISYSIALDNFETYTSFYGTVDVENNKHVNKNTRYRIGTLSMIYTAYLVFKLVEEDKFRFCHPIANKTFNGNKVEITLEQLLKHQSGMSDLTDEVLRSTKQMDNETIMKDFEENSSPVLPHIPGNYVYSRKGYSLLGFLVERANNTTYYEAMQEALRKLYRGKSTRAIDDTINVVRHLSRHYQRTSDMLVLQPAKYVRPSNYESVFGMVLPVDQLAYFAHSLLKITQEIDPHYRGPYHLGILSQDHALLFFESLHDNTIYDRESGHHVKNCIFGKKLHLDKSDQSGGEIQSKAWASSSTIGSSSFVMIRGFNEEPPLDHRHQHKTRPDVKPNLSIAIMCNLEGVKLYKLADRISALFTDAYQEYSEWLIRDCEAKKGKKRSCSAAGMT